MRLPGLSLPQLIPLVGVADGAMVHVTVARAKCARPPPMPACPSFRPDALLVQAESWSSVAPGTARAFLLASPLWEAAPAQTPEPAVDYGPAVCNVFLISPHSLGE